MLPGPLVHWLTGHSGVGIALLALLVLVLSLRILKKLAMVAVEIAVLAFLIVLATRLGWISWWSEVR